VRNSASGEPISQLEANRSATVDGWRATADDDEHYVYAIAL
jgi:hypothetical protein